MLSTIKGIIAGLIATAVISIFLIIEMKMKLIPELNIISMLSSQTGGNQVFGWITHFMIGGIAYGITYSILRKLLPGIHFYSKGIALGVMGWLVLMLAIMPTMGHDLFAMKLGIITPIAILILHIIFGFVLGISYKKLSGF